MAKDPAFLFYPSDFLTGTMFMSNEQLGIYIRLLCSQHQHGGIINKLAFDSLVKDDQLLKSKFIETETGYYNERLTIEMDKRNKKSNNMSEAAKEVWEKRKNTIASKNDTIVLQKQSKSKAKVNKNDTIAIQTVNVNKDINVLVKSEYEKTLDLFIEMRAKIKKPLTDHALNLIRKSLQELSKGSHDVAIQILNQSILNCWQDVFPLKNKNQQQNGTNNATVQAPIKSEPLLGVDRSKL